MTEDELADIQPLELPDRLTKKWLRGLSDDDLVRARIAAWISYDHWQNYSDARVQSDRLARVEDEMDRRLMAEKGGRR